MAKTDNNITSKFLACIKAKRLENFVNDKSLIPVYASSTAKVYPYQIAAARFALRSDYLKGCILCDEASLGKTYEALLVAGQKWYEGKENILIILPDNLLPQWFRKLKTDFTLPYSFWNNTKEIPDVAGLIITTYDNAIKRAGKIKERDWNLVVFDEADALINYEKDSVKLLKDVVGNAFKLLLTPTPITKDIRDIYGLIHFIDESVLPDVDWFYKRYFRKPENYPELAEWVSKFCFRTLKTQATEYVNFSRRIPITVDYPIIKEEMELYKLISTYIATDNKVAYPEIDNYNLSLRFFKTISSSTQAFANLLDTPIEKTYGIEKALLLDMQEKAKNIKANSKTLQLVKILKKVFNHLKSSKVNQKAIVFVELNATLDTLQRIFNSEGFNAIKYKDEDSLEKFRTDDDVQILVATDSAAKGIDLEFCPVEVNFDVPYNSIIMEQRICRCHRQGQYSDVLIINMLSKENFADVRCLELINKRILQFNSTFGMSDDIVGNFDKKIQEVLQSFRHKDEVAKDFKENLTTHRQINEELVKGTEDILFTTFTKSISDKITITPEYIEERINEINADLWEVIKFYFLNIKPDWYKIDDKNQTLKLIEGYTRPYLFDYRNEMNRRRTYNGYQQYGMAKDFKPERGRITLTTEFVKGVLKELDMINDSEAIIRVNSDIEPCEIGFYNATILSSKDVATTQSILIGQKQNGEILNDKQCCELLQLPVESVETRDTIGKITIGKLLTDFQCGSLDNKISKESILQEYFKNQDGSISFEVEKLKLIACRKKTQLETTLNDIKTDIKNRKKQIENEMQDSLTELKAIKQVKILEKELLKKEEGLFFDKAQIDVDTEKEIEELTKEYNFKVLTAPHFKIQLLSSKH